MKIKQIVLLSVLALAVSVAAFCMGWRLGVVIKHQQTGDNGALSSTASFPSASKLRSEKMDVTNATIGNLGSVGPEQIFDLLWNADAELRQNWARQLESLPFSPRKVAAVRAFYKALVQLDTTAATQLLVRSQDWGTRELGIRAAIGAAPPTAMSELAGMLDQLGKEERRAHIHNVIWNWTMTDPKSVARYIEEHADDVQRNDPYLLMHNWTAVDPPAAKAWLERVHLDEEKTEQAIKGLMGGLLDRDRKAAVDYLVAHAHEDRFRLALATVAADCFVNSPEEARDLVLRLPNAEAKNTAIDPITNLSNSYWVEDWKRSPESIARWLVSLPPDVWREHIGSVEREWSETDHDQFLGWINQLSPENRNIAVAQYCAAAGHQQADEDLERAITLGNSITDTSLRDDTLRNVIRGSLRSRAEIIEMLNRLQLTPSQKASLTELIPAE